MWMTVDDGYIDGFVGYGLEGNGGDKYEGESTDRWYCIFR